MKLNLAVFGNYQLNVYNQLGQRVFNQVVVSTGAENTIKIDKAIFNDNQGVYFVEIAQNNKSLFVKRLVKNKV